MLPHRVPLVARIAAAILENARRDLADIRTGTAATAPELVDLAATLLRLRPATRAAGLAPFEGLLGIDACAARTTCRVQAKSKTGGSRSAAIKLTNALHFAKQANSCLLVPGRQGRQPRAEAVAPKNRSAAGPFDTESLAP